VTSVILTIAIVWLAAFLGDTCSYWLGAKLGRGWVLEHGHRLRITPERFEQVEGYFGRHGGKTILIGRFIGLVRALAPFIAGSSQMPYGQMAPYSILGTGLWAAVFTLLGYFASKNIDAVLSSSEHVLLAFAVIVALVVAGIVAYKHMREPANRARVAAWMDERRGFRELLALGRRMAPPTRFVIDRLTPGGLGLEFTSSIAAFAVGSFIVAGYAIVLGGDPGPTPGDTTVADLMADIRTDWLTSVAKVVTAFGSGAAMLAAVAAASIWLAARRHWPEFWVLVVGTIVILFGVDAIKDAVDRPRPPGALVPTGGSAYPSGHAAHAVAYSWIALTVALRLRPGMQRGALLVAAGVVVTGAIGLSRVYLGVHYMSDVSGGWGLGVAVFALLSAIAVAVTHFRQNGADVA
jgi:membrane protein DedA with SNARE-associated domain